MQTLILTAQLDKASQAFFQRLRQQHYPASLNQISAHLTMFHQLPPSAVEPVNRAAQQPLFSMEVTGLRSLGRGVAYTLRSDTLLKLHADLSRTLSERLIPQDRQKFSPHIVIQNKVTPEASRKLLAELQQDFRPFEVQAVGLALWNYLGGPWELARMFPFREE